MTRHTDCHGVRLTGCGRANVGTVRTLLTPFDRLKPEAGRSPTRVVGRRHWARLVSAAVARAQPFGSVGTIASAKIRLLPFQLEPALAMLRLGRLRLLIADEVGLGKTIQTGVILRQLASDVDGFRALVLTPAGVRDQWQQELHDRFRLAAMVADAAWLIERTRELPPEINPWSLPGIHIASLDLVKRPEVLRALEDVAWDVTVVDEVHTAGLGTARLAAAAALTSRARRVVLLTATPPDDNPAHLDAIISLGRLGESEAITQFRRSRRDAGFAARRKSVLLPVRLSSPERRMHRLLDSYTRLVWSEAGARQDARARLAAVILRKRALSSAASLALSVRRRLLLLGTAPVADGQQLLLPLGDEDPLDDSLPDGLLGASGLADVKLERELLERIAGAADLASRTESKLALLRRLLSRTPEVMIIFTEYRDTLAQLAGMVSRTRPVLQLHGGMTPRERVNVQRAFNSDGAVLLATDAASEGLNLHERCRLVVHFELPWTPARLEQRTGRVDRLGQTRTVHEVLLVARHTSERLVLAPLLERARSAAARGGSAARAASLSESAVANIVMGELPQVEGPLSAPPDVATLDIRNEADAEALQLTTLRRLTAILEPASSLGARGGLVVSRARRRAGRSVLVLVEVDIERSDGRVVHRDIVPLVISHVASALPRAASALARLAESFVSAQGAAIFRVAQDRCHGDHLLVCARYLAWLTAAAARERIIATATPSAARRLVQIGLFDGRQVSVLAARRRAASLALLEGDERVADLAPDVSLRTRTRVVAIRFGWDPQP